MAKYSEKSRHMDFLTKLIDNYARKNARYYYQNNDQDSKLWAIRVDKSIW